LFFFIIIIALSGNDYAYGQNNPRKSELIRVINTESQENLLMGKVQKGIIDEQQRVFIIDNGNKQIHYFGSNGELKRSFGREGRGPGEFTEATGGTLSEDGNTFYVLDAPNSRVVSYDVQTGTHLETIVIKEAAPNFSNDIISFNDQIILLGNYHTKDEMLHVLNHQGEVASSFGEFIDFSNFVHNNNGKMQLSLVNASYYNGKLLVSLAAPKRVKLYDSNLNLTHEFEKELLPTPWETHMVMRPDKYDVTFYSMSLNSQIISDDLYLFQWLEVIDPVESITNMHLELRSLENGGLMGRRALQNPINSHPVL